MRKAAADAALKAAQDITAAVAAEFAEDRGEIVEDATDADTTHPKVTPGPLSNLHSSGTSQPYADHCITICFTGT